MEQKVSLYFSCVRDDGTEMVLKNNGHVHVCFVKHHDVVGGGSGHSLYVDENGRWGIGEGG